MRLKISSAPSPQNLVIGYAANLSASSHVGVSVAAAAKQIGPTSAARTRFTFPSKEQAWPEVLGRMSVYLAIQAFAML